MTTPIKLTPDEERALEFYVHTPTESQVAFVDLGKRLIHGRGISTGSRVLDHYIVPTRAPWVRGWMARPNEFKTTVLSILAKEEAKYLVNSGITDKFYVAVITYETSVDAQVGRFTTHTYDLEDFWRGKVSEDVIVRSSMNLPDLPIYWFGESMMKSTIRTNPPPMTIDMCLSGMRALYKIEGRTPSLIILDYAQIIEVEKGSLGKKRTEQIMQSIRDVIRLGSQVKAPVEIGIQASVRSLQTKPYPIPSKGDTEWAYSIEQYLDTLVGMWSVWATHANDKTMQDHGLTLPGFKGMTFDMVPGLTVMRTNKQRPALAKMDVPVIIDVPGLKIKDIPGTIPGPNQGVIP